VFEVRGTIAYEELRRRKADKDLDGINALTLEVRPPSHGAGWAG
jgi:hypothetical protein